MRAVLQQLPEHPGASLLPVAGRPLIARQLQWLRMIGVDGVAVEIGSSAESAEVARWLTEDDAIGAGVTLVLTGRGLSPREIARRAGFEGSAPLLVIPADVAVGGKLDAALDAAGASCGVTRLSRPEALASRFEDGAVSILAPPSAELSRVTLPGWAVRIRSLADAMALGEAALDGRLAPRPDDPSWGIQVHAAEVSPGVWISRGARVDPGAEIIAPALIGVGAVVCAGACVGPRVCLGDRAVVEAGTTLRDALVAAGTIVGEGLALVHVAVDAGGMRDLETGALREIVDPLVLTARGRASSTSLWTRALALLLLLIVSPLAALSPLLAAGFGRAPAGARRWVMCLLEAARGTRALVGLSDWTEPCPEGAPAALYRAALSTPRGIFAVDAALSPPGADAATRLRLRAWYASAKSFWVDARLLLRCLSARGPGRP